MHTVVRLSPELHQAAVAHLSASDPVMRQIIETVGPLPLRPRRNRFLTLVRAIVSQQISTAAARSILARLQAAAGPGGVTPEALARMKPDVYQRAGISPQKQVYLKDLARHVLEGEVRLDRMGRMADEAVVEELIRVKGIGRWTAQMFLIFNLRRADVFPHDDLGVRTALQRLYGLSELPKKDAAHRIAEAWRPYATVGSLYCWHVLSLPRASPAIPSVPISSPARSKMKSRSKTRR